MIRQVAYVGCRTTRERNARGAGLGVFEVDEDGAWACKQTVVGLPNPSFLTFGPGSTLYTVHGDQSSVTAFRMDPDGSLAPLGSQDTGGRNPVHLVTDEGYRNLLVANYATGSVARLPIMPDGSLGPVEQLIEFIGERGPHRTQQKGSHPHQILKHTTGQRFIVPDKGLDRIFVLESDPATGALRLDDSQTIPGREGSGPRHGAFHPAGTTLYVANELDSTVTTLRLTEGGAQPAEIISTLPRTCVATSHAAGIVTTPCGRWVLVSNRGHDSITTFSVDPSTLTLTPVAWAPTLGAKPRFITLDPAGGKLLVANEDSDTIIAFDIDPLTGELTAVGEPIRTGSPVCILFRPAAQGHGRAEVADLEETV